jgi:hypothetical protein
MLNSLVKIKGRPRCYIADTTLDEIYGYCSTANRESLGVMTPTAFNCPKQGT